MPAPATIELVEGAADPIRMSVINAAIELTTYRSSYPGSTVNEAQRVLAQGFASATGHAYDEAAALLGALPPLQLPLDAERQGAIRLLLRELIAGLRPAWSRLIPKGRRFVAAYLPKNAYQCFDAAGLYADVPDADALQWWDSLSSDFRSAADLERTAIGREGERLTIAHEVERLSVLGRSDLKPKWVALEDNSLGYDVLSYTLASDGAVHPLHIEVKSSSTGSKRLFVTRNEWKSAVSMADSFAIHFWDLRSRALMVLTVDELRASVPADQGRGRWETVQVSVG